MPVQIHLGHLNLSSLLVFLVIFSGQIQVSEHSHVLHDQPSHPGSQENGLGLVGNALSQCGSPDGFVSALPVGLIPKLQPPSHLPLSMDQYKVLAIFHAQQCLKPAGELYCEIAM